MGRGTIEQGGHQQCICRSRVFRVHVRRGDFRQDVDNSFRSETMFDNVDPRLRDLLIGRVSIELSDFEGANRSASRVMEHSQKRANKNHESGANAPGLLNQ
jgi:hypothetical protein